MESERPATTFPTNVIMMKPTQPTITIIDSIMGSGKSSYVIKYINRKPEQRYLIVVKYLDEANRFQRECSAAHFHQPVTYNGSKQASFKVLLREGKNIILTHELYSRLSFTAAEIRLINEYNYRLILDEVAEVIEPLNISSRDKEIILTNCATVDPQTGLVTWTDKEYTGRYAEIKRQIESKAVIYFSDSLFLWLLPLQLLKAFRHITVLTFMFQGSHMKNYLDLHYLKYDTTHIRQVDGAMSCSQEDRT